MTDKVVVVHPDSMSDEDFEKHMNARHSDGLGELEKIDLHTNALVSVWRSYHNRLHMTRPSIAHEHGPFVRKTRLPVSIPGGNLRRVYRYRVRPVRAISRDERSAPGRPRLAA